MEWTRAGAELCRSIRDTPPLSGHQKAEAVREKTRGWGLLGGSLEGGSLVYVCVLVRKCDRVRCSCVAARQWVSVHPL